MSILDENFILENGVQIPKLGFGTWQIPNGKVAYDAVTFALKNGYRHIDTARAYGNEESVGKAVRDSGIERNNIFITTKLPAEIKTYEGAKKSIEETMTALGLEYIDLYLIHAPWPWSQMGADCRKGNAEVWRAMEEFYQSGRCRAIGVSNFSVSDITSLMRTATIKPMANQIRFFIGNAQEEVTQYCQQNNILVEGYSPLATGAILKNVKVAELAKKYNATLPTICIRYVLQKGALPLPKSTHEEYILQNKEIDFVITEEDMRYLDSLKDTLK
jgi:diketogulonate reductase-like aldo/keto reductase